MQHLQNWLQDLTLIKLSSKSVLKLTKWIAQTLQTNEWNIYVEAIDEEKKLFYLFSGRVDMESLWEGEGTTFQTLVDLLTKSLRWDPPLSSV